MNVLGDRTVAVTGASGFIGSNVVRSLLEHGASVHACVRKVDASSKTRHLHLWRQQYPDALRLFEADVEVAGSHERAFAGCTDLIHSAAKVAIEAPDPQKEIVDVAVKGTANVMQSALEAPGLRRVVLTSSIAAVLSDNKPSDYEYSEADWCEDATVETNPYGLAKTLSERQFWKTIDESAGKLTGVALNPSLVIGEVFAAHHIEGSNRVVADIVGRNYPGCPKIRFDYVAARDVATAHVRALTEERATGQRLILTKQSLLWREVALILSSQYDVATRELPNLLVLAVAMFDPRSSVKMARRLLLGRRRIRAALAQEVLGFELTELESSFFEAARSAVALGFVRASVATPR